MKMHEPDCYDGKHPAAEHVGWMVAERGLHEVNGVKMLFDKTTVSGNGWNTVNFNGFSSTPNVITTLTNDATKFAYLRHQGLTSSTFQIHLDGSSNTHNHNYQSNEASYVVIERSSGSNLNKKFQAGKSTGHTEASKQISLSQSMSNSNYAIFAGVTMNGGDAGNIRFHYSGKSATKFTVGFDEAESCGWDGPHPAQEDVYWFALDTGILEGRTAVSKVQVVSGSYVHNLSGAPEGGKGMSGCLRKDYDGGANVASVAKITAEPGLSSWDNSYNFVGIQCCSSNGSGNRFAGSGCGGNSNCANNCKSGTYQEAVDFCVSKGMDLCTAAQLKAGAGEASGCQFDHTYVWSKSSC